MAETWGDAEIETLRLHVQSLSDEITVLRAELGAWRTTFEEQTTNGASRLCYRECYAIGTRKLLRSTEAPRDE
jgi:hypothetical protein